MNDLQQGLLRHLAPEALDSLARARIGIAGAGGLGSNVAVLLVRSGIRNLIVADFDRVEASNLNRQAFFPQDLGKPKVLALGDLLRRLEPDLEYAGHDLRLTPENAPTLFAGCDLVVEAVDAADTKAGLCAALLQAGFFVVAASGLGGFGGPSMHTRRVGKNLVLVGDETAEVSADTPPLAPRVMQAAALQADVVLEYILENTSGGRALPCTRRGA